MDNIIEIYKAQLSIEKEKLIEISEKIIPLEKERDRTEKNIEALKQLIGLNEETEQIIIKEKMIDNLSNKTPMKAYEELAKDYFKGGSFKEPKIRKVATEKGLEVSGKSISDSYSRQVIAKLTVNGIFEKIKKGTYRYRQKEEKGVEGFGLA